MSDQNGAETAEADAAVPSVQEPEEKIVPAVKRYSGKRGRPRTLQIVNGSDYRYRLPRLPRGCERINGDARDFQKLLEVAVRKRGRMVDQYIASLIFSACVHHERVCCYAKIMRDSFAQMTFAERATYLDKMGTATDAKDACLKKMGLSEQDVGDNPWAGLNSTHGAVEVLPAPGTKLEPIKDPDPPPDEDESLP